MCFHSPLMRHAHTLCFFFSPPSALQLFAAGELASSSARPKLSEILLAAILVALLALITVQSQATAAEVKQPKAKAN